MSNQWDRFEYRLFRDDNTVSIRKIYYENDIPHAYSNPVSMQGEDFVNLWGLLKIAIDAFCMPTLDKSYFKNE